VENFLGARGSDVRSCFLGVSVGPHPSFLTSTPQAYPLSNFRPNSVSTLSHLTGRFVSAMTPSGDLFPLGMRPVSPLLFCVQQSLGPRSKLLDLTIDLRMFLFALAPARFGLFAPHGPPHVFFFFC